MSPVKNTKSKGLMKWSLAIWFMTKPPKGAKVPISPKTDILSYSSSWTFRGADLKYFIEEKTPVY